MISFRFYLVTLVAIFLSVALGVAIGSTFAEPRLIENLRNQIDTVENRLDERVARIDRLGSEIDDLEAYVEQSAPFAIEHRLDGQRVLVVAEEGTDNDTVERLVGRLRQSGSETEGIVWLDPRWGSDESVDEVATGLGLAPDESTETPLAAWETLLEAASPAPTTDPTATTVPDETVPEETTTVPEETVPDETTTVPEETTTVPDETVPDETDLGVTVFESEAMTILADAGWLRVQAMEGSGPDEPELAEPEEVPIELLVVFVTSPESELGRGGPVVGALARHQATLGVPALVAEAWADVAEGDDTTERASHVAGIREDPELSALVSTVDDLDLIQGQVASVLALADLVDGVVGHYGYGQGADRVLPTWLGP